MLPASDQGVRRGGDGLDIVVEQSGPGRALLVLGVMRAGLLGRVGAQQVMERVAARCMLGQQVRAGQASQQPAGLAHRDCCELGGGMHGNVRAGMQAQ